jgi:hypothetical protein
MSTRRHFWWGYPPVFADVGEGKELRTGGVDGGEGKELGEESLQSTVDSLERGKTTEDFTTENTEGTENTVVGAAKRKWKFENGPPSRESIASADSREGEG